jgi:uncharacterized protein YkwD
MFLKSARSGLVAGALFLCSAGLLGCAQVVVTRDPAQNQTSVKIEPLFGSRARSAMPTTAVQSQSLGQMEEAIRNRINAQRQKQGLQPLQANPKLRTVARDYSRRMSQQKFFSHYDARGKSVADRVKGAGVRYQMVGENLFKSINLPNVVKSSVEGWMKSKGHRANILRREYTQTGVGIWKSGNSYHVTQIFLRPR